MNRKVHAGFGPADEGSTVKKLPASTSSDWYIVLCRSREQAELALRVVRETVSTLRLELEPAKTSITTFERGFEYLGCTFIQDYFYFERDGQRVTVRGDADWDLFYNHGPQGYE